MFGCTLLGSLALLQSAVSPATETVFVHVDVVTMTDEAVLRDRTVVVRGDRIHAVGTADELAPSADARIVDGAGRYLMPGLADMHVHPWSEDQLLLFLANGVTTVRNMFGAPVHVQWRDEIAAGERLGPTIWTAGPILDGDPPIWPRSRIVTTWEEGAAAVADQVAAGYDFVKVYERLTRDAYDGIVVAAAEAGIPVMGHVPGDVGLEAALASGQRTIEHLDKYEAFLQPAGRATRYESWAELLASWRTIEQDRIAEAVERTVDSGVWNCPTLVMMQKVVDEDGIDVELARPYMRYVSASTKSRWATTARQQAADSEAARAGDSPRAELTRALAEGGARLLLGTDQGNPFVAAGFSIHEELALLVEAGLTPYEALCAGTRNAAECLGAADQLGTIAPGLRADLLLLEGNPLEDVANLQRRAGVMVRGRWLPEAELRERLEALVEPGPAGD